MESRRTREEQLTEYLLKAYEERTELAWKILLLKNELMRATGKNMKEIEKYLEENPCPHTK